VTRQLDAPLNKTAPVPLYAEATYHVIRNEDGTFSVEVRIPDTHPTKIGPFLASADAGAWIAEQRSRVDAQSAALVNFP
jgi:hypothetical protein